MARRKSEAEEDPLLQLNDDQLIKELRRYEKLCAAYKADTQLERKMRRQAEDELSVARQKVDLMLVTRQDLELGPIRVIPEARGDVSIPLLCLTDWHFEEIVKASMVNGLNEYNPAIATRRAERIFDKAVQLLRKLQASWPTLLLWFGGDFINGYIHPEFRVTNAMAPIQAIREVQQLLIRGIKHLHKELGVKQMYVGTSVGNHSRPSEEKLIDTEIENSYEFMMYHNIADHFRNDKWFDIQLPSAYHFYWQIFDMSLRFQHGHAINYGGGVGGISIPVRKAIGQWNKARQVRYDIFGHFHQSKAEDNWVSCGCLVGYNPYAIRIKADPERPSQALLIFSQENELWGQFDLYPEKRRFGDVQVQSLKLAA